MVMWVKVTLPNRDFSIYLKNELSDIRPKMGGDVRTVAILIPFS